MIIVELSSENICKVLHKPYANEIIFLLRDFLHSMVLGAQNGAHTAASFRSYRMSTIVRTEYRPHRVEKTPQ